MIRNAMLSTKILSASLAVAMLAAVGCGKSDDPAPGAAGKMTRNQPDPKQKGTEPAAPTDSPEISLDDATDGLPKDGKLMADFTTPQGTIHCELFADKAPRTVASFVGLARGKRAWLDPTTHNWVKTPFYDGLAFHRVIATFMIQGGDPLSREYGSAGIGTGSPGFTIADELSPDLKFDRPGRLAVANKGPRTHSGSSQFFITEGPTPRLDGGYAIFGQCDDNDIVQAIARVPKGAQDKPTTPVTMTVKIYRK